MNVQMRLITADNIDELTAMKESNIVKLTGLNNLEEVAEATNKKLVKDNTAYKDIEMDRSIVEEQTQDSPLFEDWSGQVDTGFPADPTVPGVFSEYQMQNPFDQVQILIGSTYYLDGNPNRPLMVTTIDTSGFVDSYTVRDLNTGKNIYNRK